MTGSDLVRRRTRRKKRPCRDAGHTYSETRPPQEISTAPFDRARFLAYTSLVCRDVFHPTGATAVAVVVGRIIFSPGTLHDGMG